MTEKHPAKPTEAEVRTAEAFEKRDAAQHEEAEALAKRVAAILDAKKALDLKVLNVKEQTILADFLVFASGTSTTQVNAMADEVEFKLSQDGTEPLRVEGRGSGSWVLLDYGSVIVHVFGRESKEFYKLDKLWSAGVEVALDKIPEEQ